MELTNEFVIDRPVEETWEILNDLEFIAPCMPGAQLQEIEGDEYRGVVKIKVGPITAQYKGKASFIEQDAENHVAKLKAEGRDPRQGNANAMVTAKMQPAGETQTTVNIHTDLGLSGKIASFGRGAIEDVSKKILNQFTENLREKLEVGAGAGESAEPATDGAVADTAANSASSSAASSGAAPSPSAAGPSAAASSGAAKSPSAAGSSAASSSGAAKSPSATGSSAASPSGAAKSPAAPVSGIRKIDGPEAEPVDLLAVSRESVLKRLVPTVGGAAIVAIILYWLLGRG